MADEKQDFVLHRSMKERKFELSLQLITQGADLNTLDDEGMSPLHRAAHTWQNELIELMIMYGADVNIRSKRGLTPLHFAAYEGDKDSITALLSSGADVNAQDDSGETPLHSISRLCCFSEIAALLIRKGANVNIKDRKGETALHYAALTEDCALMNEILSAGADILCLNNSRLSPIHIVFKNLKFKMYRYIIEKCDERRVELSGIFSEFGFSELHSAVMRGNIKEDSLNLKQDIDARDNNGYTPLHLAVLINDVKAAMLLIREGADIYALDNKNMFPLRLAGCSENSEMLDFFLGNSSNRMLFEALCKEDDQTVSFLLNEFGLGVDNNRYILDSSPLHLDVMINRSYLLNELSLDGEACNIQDSYGYTPLHLAVLRKNYAFIRDLSEIDGLDPDIADAYGRTPLYLAVLNGYTEVIPLLLDYGVKALIPDINGITPLELAEKSGREDIVFLLSSTREENISSQF